MPSKNQVKRAKKKALKQNKTEHLNQNELPQAQTRSEQASPAPHLKDHTPFNVDAAFDGPFVVDEGNTLYDMYKDVMGKFEEPSDVVIRKEPEKPQIFYDDEDDIPEEDEHTPLSTHSRKKRKEMNKLSVAQLKAMVKNPENVDWTDTSASDPRLLVHMKAYRNVVPVPSHWSLKREYLSSKRGVEKPAFALPRFIQETGITEMRDAVLEKQDQASLKQRQRERVQPKMGKLDIDYQKLYEAFFRFQTKPELTRYGEVYYEGKEYETNLRHLRPGELSEELKDALNIPPGAPPPWLINQQRFGPPPSYPALKIPGLNAPIPSGASWGFQPGQWGKPPVDEATNRPLFGGDLHNIFQTLQKPQRGEPIEKDLWGELEEPEESDEEDEGEDDEADEEEQAEGDGNSGLETPGGFESQSGLSSTLPSEFGGTVTVSELDLRKRRPNETDRSSHPSTPGQVIPDRKTQVQGLFGSERTYDLSHVSNGVPVLGQEDNKKRKKPGDVDVAVDPEILHKDEGLDKSKLRDLYDQQRNQGSASRFQEDLSDMIASESRKRLKQDAERRRN